MSTEDPRLVCTCPRIDAAQFGLYGEGHHYVLGRPDPNCYFHGGSTPVSEEPAPWTSGWKVSSSDLIPMGPTQADVDAAYARGISEGRRQATEGWEREWGGRWMQDAVEPTDDVYLCSSETDARALEERSGGYRRAESRLVGPWEPAEGGSDA